MVDAIRERDPEWARRIIEGWEADGEKMLKPKDEWITNHEELVTFARVLEGCGVLSTADDTIRYFAEPHDWSPERAQWVALGRPETVDDIDELRKETSDAA